jgi:hypothetical protein
MDELIAIALVDEGSLDVNLNTLNITSDDEGHESLESPKDDGGSPGGDAVPCGDGVLVAEEVQEDDPQKHAYDRKPRKKTSPIWKDFKEVVKSGAKKAQCIHRKSIFDIPTSGATAQFHRHLNSCIPCIAANKKQKVLTFDSEGGSMSSGSNFT